MHFWIPPLCMSFPLPEHLPCLPPCSSVRRVKAQIQFEIDLNLVPAGCLLFRGHRIRPLTEVGGQHRGAEHSTHSAHLLTSLCHGCACACARVCACARARVCVCVCVCGVHGDMCTLAVSLSPGAICHATYPLQPDAHPLMQQHLLGPPPPPHTCADGNAFQLLYSIVPPARPAKAAWDDVGRVAVYESGKWS